MEEDLKSGIRLIPDNPQIPCPANGDTILLVRHVDDYAPKTGMSPVCKSELDGLYSVWSNAEKERYVYVMAIPQDFPPSVKKLAFRLLCQMPSFDSVSLWQAEDEDSRTWMVFIHFPISGKMPIPQECRAFFDLPDCACKLGDVTIQAYLCDKHRTLRDWAAEPCHHSPNEMLDVLKRIASIVNQVYELGHSMIRISPDTIAISETDVHFMGLVSMNLPWNERCVDAYQLAELASVAPECRGYMRKHATMTQTVYAFGALAYFLIAHVLPPTCEEIGFEPGLNPRAYSPAFPIGWDNVILRALSAIPQNRQKNIDAFILDLEDAYGDMCERNKEHPALHYDAAVDTHIGITKCLRCPVNQDAVLMRHNKKGRYLLVVGDGVSTSTYGSGDIASGLLIETANRIWDEKAADAESINPKELVHEILEESNNSICQYIEDRYADQNPQPSDCMGSTALVAIIESGVLTISSLGDSRAYLIRNTSMECITRDHNLYTIGLINGVPVEVCASHPHAGSLVQCLGYNYDENGNIEDISFDTYCLHLIPGDTLLMTTDGILDYIAYDITESENKIAEIVRAGQSAAETCTELILQANIGGGGDNCGLAVVRVS